MSAREWLSDPKKGVVPGVRAAQIKFAESVEAVLTNGGIFFGEAGTGTGKSIGYLVPAMEALQNGTVKRVVISTGKKNLQRQIAKKDAPRVAEAMKGEGNARVVASLKGRSNYLCVLRHEEFMADAASRFSQDLVGRFEIWAEETPDGDLAEFPESLPFDYLVRVGECLGPVCPHRDECAYRDSRALADRAKILIVNHALLAYDLATGGGKVLGEYDALIIDEAHLAPKFFRDAWTYRLTPKQPEQIAALYARADASLPSGEKVALSQRVGWAYQELFSILGERPQGRFSNDAATLRLLNDLHVLFQAERKQLSKLGVNTGGTGEEDEPPPPTNPSVTPRALAKLKAAATIIDGALNLLVKTLGLDEKTGPEFDPETGVQLPPRPKATYIQYTERSGYDKPMELISAPVEVGPLVAPALLHINRVVVTSATLATGTSFDYSAREYGLHPAQLTRVLQVESPFDFKNRTALYISKTAPMLDGSATAYDNMAGEIHELLEASRGGAFILCASHNDLNNLHERLNATRRRYHLLRQPVDGGVEPVIAAIKARPDVVVIGAKMLWEGVDVPGLNLRLVIIPRIPFPNKGDILAQARKDAFIAEKVREGDKPSEAGFKSFAMFDLNEAIMHVKQGTGRLMRDESDLGIAAILDPRMNPRPHPSAKAYGPQIRSNCSQPVTYDRAFVLQFLGQLGSRLVP